MNSNLSIAPQLPYLVGKDTIATQLTSHRLNKYNMVQSAVDTRKTLFHIVAFWEKPTITPLLSWDKWTQQWNFALLAKEGIQLETLLNGPPLAVTYPSEPAYEEPVENHTQATEMDRKVVNEQLKLTW